MKLRQIMVSKASMPAGWIQEVCRNEQVGPATYNSPAVEKSLDQISPQHNWSATFWVILSCVCRIVHLPVWMPSQRYKKVDVRSRLRLMSESQHGRRIILTRTSPSFYSPAGFPGFIDETIALGGVCHSRLFGSHLTRYLDIRLPRRKDDGLHSADRRNAEEEAGKFLPRLRASGSAYSPSLLLFPSQAQLLIHVPSPCRGTSSRLFPITL
jgi:hypothetical protein